MDIITLQVPVNARIKNQAQDQAKAMGFSSLQEVVRLFLNQLAEKSINVRFIPQIPVETLSSAQEEQLSKATQGTYKKVNTIEAMMDHLKSE